MLGTLHHEWGTYHLDSHVTFTGNVHIHPVVKGLSPGTVLGQDERDIDALLVLYSHIPVLSRAMVFDLMWTSGYGGLHMGQQRIVSLFTSGKTSPAKSS